MKYVKVFNCIILAFFLLTACGSSGQEAEPVTEQVLSQEESPEEIAYEPWAEQDYVLQHPLTSRFLSSLFSEPDSVYHNKKLPVRATQLDEDDSYQVLFSGDYVLRVTPYAELPVLDTRDDCIDFFQEELEDGTFLEFQCYTMEDGLLYQWETWGSSADDMSHVTTLISLPEGNWKLEEVNGHVAGRTLWQEADASFSYMLERRTYRGRYLHWYDKRAQVTSYLPDLVPDKRNIPFRFDVTTLSVTEGELYHTYDLEISVFRPGEEEPFQTFQQISYTGGGLTFDDINMDGHRDVAIEIMSSASNADFAHYVWSASKGIFVEADGSMGFNAGFGTVPKRGLLYEHIHGSAIDGSELAYRWVSETETTLVRDFSHDQDGDGNMVCCITDYEGGEKIVLLDWTGPYEVYDMDYASFFDFFYTDIQWQDSFTAPETGERISLYFGETDSTDSAGKLTLYEGNLFVVGENGSLFQRFALTNTCPCEDISWAQEGEDNVLVIHYTDGSMIRVPQDCLVQMPAQEDDAIIGAAASVFDGLLHEDYLITDLGSDGRPDLVLNNPNDEKRPEFWFRVLELHSGTTNPFAAEKTVVLPKEITIRPYSSQYFPTDMRGLRYVDESTGNDTYLIAFYDGHTEEETYNLRWLTLTKRRGGYELSVLPEDVEDVDAYFAGCKKSCVFLGQWEDSNRSSKEDLARRYSMRREFWIE